MQPQLPQLALALGALGFALLLTGCAAYMLFRRSQEVAALRTRCTELEGSRREALDGVRSAQDREGAARAHATRLTQELEGAQRVLGALRKTCSEREAALAHAREDLEESGRTIAELAERLTRDEVESRSLRKALATLQHTVTAT